MIAKIEISKDKIVIEKFNETIQNGEALTEDKETKVQEALEKVNQPSRYLLDQNRLLVAEA